MSDYVYDVGIEVGSSFLTIAGGGDCKDYETAAEFRKIISVHRIGTKEYKTVIRKREVKNVRHTR